VAVQMPLPLVEAASPHRTVTLGELRELVRAADQLGLGDELVVRGHAIPFKLSDLGNKRGACLTTLALDHTP
jgi:hypothetical protein